MGDVFRISCRAENAMRDILSDYFWLQRMAFGDEQLALAMAMDGWTLADHIHLCGALAEGMGNIAALAAGDWTSREIPIQHGIRTAADLDRALRDELNWLWVSAASLRYPIIWDSSPEISEVWRRFWGRVATIIGRSVRTGVPIGSSCRDEQMANFGFAPVPDDRPRAVSHRRSILQRLFHPRGGTVAIPIGVGR